MKEFKIAALAFAMAFASNAFAAEELVLYSSNNVDTIKVVTDGFAQKHPDIQVSVVHSGTGSLMKRIKAEAKNPMGDIFWSGGVSTINQMQDFQEPYVNSETAAVPADMRDPNGHWLGTNMHIAILMVNTKQLPKGVKVPTTWKELADPVWKGNIVTADPARSGTSYSILYGLREVVGEDTFKKIVGNLVVSGSSAQAYQGPASGEYALGITMEYAGCEYIEGGQKEIKIVYPAEGTMKMPEGMFLIKNAKHPEAAKKFYDYLSSKDAQENLFKNTFRRSARSDFDPSKFTALPALKDIKIHEVDQNVAGQAREAFLKDFNAIRQAAQ